MSNSLNATSIPQAVPPLPPPRRSMRALLTPYAGAIALVALAWVVRIPLEFLLHGIAPYALFYLAVLASAWLWGVRSAVLATVLSALVAQEFLIPRGDSRAFASLIPFALACAGMVAMARAARLSRSREERANGYLAALVRSTDDVVLSKDLNGIIQSCNPACERLFGYKEKELVGKSILTLIPEDRYAEETELLTRLRRGERIEHFETVRVTRDGRLLDVSLSISPVFNPSGDIIGISKILRDITDSRKAARELAAQQEWFRVTLGSIGDAVIASNPDGRITFINQVAERLTGWDGDDANGRPLTEVFRILNEKTRQPAPDPTSLVLRTGQIVGLANHTVLVRKDGAEVPIADSAAPIRDASGATIGVVLVFHDVTERRRAEAELAEQNERFVRTLESIGDAVISTDVHCNVEFMNPVAEHLTGWKLNDARGKDCEGVFKIINEKTRQSVENPVKRVLDEGAIVGLANHTILISRDGTERPIDDSAAPIRNQDGRIVGVVLVFRDVTERRAVEQERHTVGADRDRLLEAERIARSEAERANRIKDDFMAMVSHELRTPLNAILGWTNVLLQTAPPDPETKRGLEVIQRNTRVQAQLISDLLDISRIVSGKLLLDVQRVNLASIIDAAIETVQHAADQKGIVLRRQIDTAIGDTIGDPARLQQVIWNLLTNAIKFTERGGHVDVIMRRLESRIEIAVSDEGQGIRPEILGHVFERFHQQDGPTTRQHGGLGLGLSIVKNLVELHGGTVRAHSAGEGKGATFTISLPMSMSDPAGGVLPEKVRETTPADRDTLRDIHVLVVEDEEDTRNMIRRLLEAHGAEVALAGSAPDALERIQERLPQILVSDIGLPGVDGYDLIRQVRSLAVAGASTLPAVALTAFARSEDRTRALRAGYQVHIAKPVEPAELVATLASFADLVRKRR